MTSQLIASLGIVGSVLSTGSCTINPATGQRQLTLIGEQQEIAMGRQYDESVRAELGLYPDEELQEYVQELGSRLAAESERPYLPWRFRVIDDPTVNAFALPGGYIYVTRGILAHFSSEAQLVAVLGHEIGHVTARHSVEQLSRAQLAQLGFGIAAIASEDFREYAGLAQIGLQVLFLKFSRDDERQSDDLGLRYLGRAGYHPAEMPKVFTMLDRQARLHGGGRIPAWQSTHPNPERRAERISEQIATLPAEQQRGTVNRDTFVRRLDGMVFGDDPRQGYTVGNAFYHPDMAFRLEFPQGWKVVNRRQAVVAVSPQEDAVVALTMAEEGTPHEAATAFFAQEGIERGQPWRQRYFNFRTTPQTDAEGGQSQSVHGAVGFIAHDGQVFRLLTYTPSEKWSEYASTLRRSLVSFGHLTDRRHLDVVPKRITLVKLPRAMTLSEFQRRYPSTIELDALAVLNSVEAEARLEVGELVKRVVGSELPGE